MTLLDAPSDMGKGLPNDAELLRRYHAQVMRLLNDLARGEGAGDGVAASTQSTQARPRSGRGHHGRRNGTARC
jgi:hypothetical protein